MENFFPRRGKTGFRSVGGGAEDRLEEPGFPGAEGRDGAGGAVRFGRFGAAGAVLEEEPVHGGGGEPGAGDEGFDGRVGGGADAGFFRGGEEFPGFEFGAQGGIFDADEAGAEGAALEMVVDDGDGGFGVGDVQEMLGAVFEGDGQQHGFLLEGIFGVAGDFGEEGKEGEQGLGGGMDPPNDLGGGGGAVGEPPGIAADEGEMLRPQGQGIGAGIVAEEFGEAVIAQRGQRSGRENERVLLRGAGAGAPEEVGAFEGASVEAGDHGGGPAVSGERPESELVGAGEEEIFQRAGLVAPGIDESFAEGAEVERLDAAGLLQMGREGFDLAWVDREGVHRVQATPLGGGRTMRKRGNERAEVRFTKGGQRDSVSVYE